MRVFKQTERSWSKLGSQFRYLLLRELANFSPISEESNDLFSCGDRYGDRDHSNYTNRLSVETISDAFRRWRKKHVLFRGRVNPKSI